jgi:ABC-type thiamin/hydroxymethylpyrimidine transport system permease subunit
MHPITVKISRCLCFVWLVVMLAIVAIITSDLGLDRWLSSLWIGQFVVTCIWGSLYVRRAGRAVMRGVAAKKEAMTGLKPRA